MHDDDIGNGFLFHNRHISVRLLSDLIFLSLKAHVKNIRGKEERKRERERGGDCEIVITAKLLHTN